MLVLMRKSASEAMRKELEQLRAAGSRADLAFRSNSSLRLLAKVSPSDHAASPFAPDLVTNWDTVMNLDRFDLA